MEAFGFDNSYTKRKSEKIGNTMFKKGQNIEQDFKLYDIDKSTQKSNTLSLIIQVLLILLLSSLLCIVFLYGYKYLNHEKKPISVISLSKPAIPKQSNTQKIYTQKEMQLIVKALMKEIEGKKKDTYKKKTENSNIKKTVISKNHDIKENENKYLLESLEKTDVDQVEAIQRKVAWDNVKMKSAKKISIDRLSQDINHYNKVIIKPSANRYDDFAILSNKINNVVKDIKRPKIKQQRYEKIISEEITTRTNEMRIIVVQEGDTLSKIAQRSYGNVLAYDKIIKANPELIENPDRIYVGQRLRVPDR